MKQIETHVTLTMNFSDNFCNAKPLLKLNIVATKFCIWTNENIGTKKSINSSEEENTI